MGRVQTPTLRLVVDRDRSISDFVPVAYWAIDVQLNDDLAFTLSHDYGDHRDLHSFPTRRSSDLGRVVEVKGFGAGLECRQGLANGGVVQCGQPQRWIAANATSHAG